VVARGGRARLAVLVLTGPQLADHAAVATRGQALEVLGNHPVQDQMDLRGVTDTDAVQVRIEGQALFRFNTDPKVVRAFYTKFGVRTFDGLHPFDGADGWRAFLAVQFRPVLDNALREGDRPPRQSRAGADRLDPCAAAGPPDAGRERQHDRRHLDMRYAILLVALSGLLYLRAYRHRGRPARGNSHPAGRITRGAARAGPITARARDPRAARGFRLPRCASELRLEREDPQLQTDEPNRITPSPSRRRPSA